MGAGIEYQAVYRATPVPCVLLDEELRIVDANTSWQELVEIPFHELEGRRLLEAFPGNPDEQDQVRAFEESLRRAFTRGETQRASALKYDVESVPGSGEFQERWWTQAAVPVADHTGTVRWLLNVVEDTTALTAERASTEQLRSAAEGLRVRTSVLEEDLYQRSLEMVELARSEAETSRRLAGLAEAAMALTGAESVEDLADVVIGQGLSALGADGGAVAVRHEATGTLRVAITDSLGADVQQVYSEVPLNGPLPASVAARTGEVILLADRAAGSAYAPEMDEVNAATGKVAWASLPLKVGERLLGSLTASWDAAQEFQEGDVRLMEAFAAQCAQALHRVLVRQAEQEAMSATRRLSETLQRSLLTAPPQPDHLQVAVRYHPAAAQAQVGGDWYDAFVVEGSTSLVIGDVSGHDREAAAAMGQVRNLLRGVSHALQTPPAEVLQRLDRALIDLVPGTLATAVLAQVEQDEAQAAEGVRVLRWSNAGHPPPVLVHPDGRAEVLRSEPDLLLGLDPRSERADHTVTLEPGATVVLYTDGLVERRGEGIDEGVERLRKVLEALAGTELEELVDEVLERLGEGGEDDVAVLAVRAHPEDRTPPSGPEGGGR